MQERGALSHLKRLSLSFFKNRKGGGKKILFLSGCLELLLVGARLQLQMCWKQCQLSWQIQYLCCCPQYLFQTAWAIKCSSCKIERESRACRCFQSLGFVFLTYLHTDCCNEGTKWFLKSGHHQFAVFLQALCPSVEAVRIEADNFTLLCRSSAQSLFTFWKRNIDLRTLL